MMRAAIGIDIGGTNIKWGIVAESGHALAEGLMATESEKGPHELLDKLSAIVAEAMLLSAGLGIELAGVGIGTAGQVHRASGIVKGATAALPGWAGMPLGERIHVDTGLPVIVDNDVNMMALGEAWLGAGRRWSDFLCVALGTGVGGCWIMDRQPYYGRQGYAGEFGHMIINMGGRECSCGNRGCWEAYASVTGLKALAEEMRPDGSLREPESLFMHARNGDETALRIVDQYGIYIAAGLTGLVHLFNPSAIVLGGAITAGQGDFLLDRIRKELTGGLMPAFQSPDPIAIVAARLGSRAGIIGAAMAALKN